MRAVAIEPPPLDRVLSVPGHQALVKLARKVSRKAKLARGKEQLIRLIVSSSATRRTILEHLKRIDLLRICQRFGVEAGRKTRTKQMVRRLCWRIFIVHRSSALGFARMLKERLVLQGPIFLDAEGIHPGTDWSREVRDAVTGAEGYLVVVSDDFSESTWAREELNRAIGKYDERGAPILVVFPDGPPPAIDQVPFGLSVFQMLDGSSSALPATLARIDEELSKLPR
jgi:hypothetical protein